MEDPISAAASVKDQSTASGRSASRLLRYPLRSATKAKDEKPPLVDSTNSVSATKRGRVASDLSKSVSVLDVSGKEKSSAKPPRRRLSVPSKSNASPAPKPFGNVTPISEARSKRTDTPVSDVSKSSHRKKFSILSSSSYWLSQVKLSETAGKHSISLGFFKLALEAGCEPIQRVSDELKSYVRRHNLSELGESVKVLFESYKISEDYEHSTVSENCSQVATDGNQLSDNDEISSLSFVTDAEKLKPKTLDINSEEVKKENSETTEKDESVKKIKKSVPKNASANSKSGSEVKSRTVQKKPQKPIKQDVGQNKDKVKKTGKKSAREEVTVNSPPEGPQENKENKGGPEMDEISLPEV